MRGTMTHSGERGIALGVVIITAIVFSIAAFGVLALSMGGAQRAGSYARRLQARYAAEAGLVWAMQRLWANPNWSDGWDGTDLTVGGMSVDVKFDPCPTPPCENRQLQAKVSY